MELRTAILRSLVATYDARDTIARLFVAAPGSRLRRADIGRAVANDTGTNYSPRHQRRVNQALKLLGYTKTVVAGNVPYTLGIERRT